MTGMPSLAPTVPRTGSQGELDDQSKAGGGTLADCQPRGHGRDERTLLERPRRSRVRGIARSASTGKNYDASETGRVSRRQRGMGYFVGEIKEGPEATRETGHWVRARYTTVACEPWREH